MPGSGPHGSGGGATAVVLEEVQNVGWERGASPAAADVAFTDAADVFWQGGAQMGRMRFCWFWDQN